MNLHTALRHLLCLALLALLSARSVQAQNVFFASPAGLATTCSLASPCALSTAVSQMASGDTLYFREGTYRQEVNPPGGYVSGADTFRTFVGAYRGEAVEYNGLDITLPTSGWTVHSGNIYRHAWTWAAVPVPNTNRIDSDENAYREMLVVDGGPVPYIPLQNSTNPNHLQPGEFYVEDNDVLHGSPEYIYVYIDDADPNPANHKLEMSSLAGFVNAKVQCDTESSDRFYHVDGLTMRYASTYWGSGFVCSGKHGGTIIENSAFEYSNSNGVFLNGDYNELRNNSFTGSGAGSMRAKHCDYCVLENNTVTGDRWKPYLTGFGHGNKLTKSRGLIVRGNVITNSPGMGIWLDESVTLSHIYSNRVDSTFWGIRVEHHSDSNFVYNNIITRSFTEEGAQESEVLGIAVVGGNHNVVAYNTLWDNQGCIRNEWSNRAGATNKRNLYYNNVCLGNAYNIQYDRQVEWSSKSSSVPHDTLATNVANGNAYWPSGTDTYFRRNISGNASNLWTTATSDFNSWRTTLGSYDSTFDDDSFIIDTELPHITNVNDYEGGWMISSNSQFRGKAVALPSSWFDPNIFTTDFFGNPRSLSGGDVGAHQFGQPTSPEPANTAQAIPFQQGWQLVSSYLLPESNSLAALFDDVSPHLVAVKDQDGRLFMPEFSIDQIGVWNPHDAYLVYMSAVDTLVISGTSLQSEERLLSLQAGWNYIPYFPVNPMGVEDALSSIGADLVLVKDGMGGVYFPAYNINTLSSMLPGRGYMVYLKDAATLLYPVDATVSTQRFQGSGGLASKGEGR